MSEKPVHSRLRRLVDWINLTGAKKVHSLIDKVYKRKNLEMAWEKVKANRGSGGVDGETLETFEAQLGQQLDRLQRELKEDTYQPQPVRQHPIPKRDKPGEYRLLGIPTIYDRVCQQALLNRLEPIFEPVFDDASFGYRRGRSTKDALRKIWKEIQGGSEWIVDADLRNFFGSVDHEKLLTLVAQRVADGRALRLIEAMLKAGSYGKGQLFPSERGTPQGGVVTPRTQKAISSLKEQLWGGEKGTHYLIFVVNSNTVMSHDPFDQDGEGSPAERCSWPVAASNGASRRSASVVTRVRLVRAPSISLLARSLPTRWTDRSSRSHCANHLETFTTNRGTAAEIREKQWPDHWSDRSQRIKCISARPKKAWLNSVKIATHFKFKFLIRLIACSSRSSRGLTRFWCHVVSTP